MNTIEVVHPTLLVRVVCELAPRDHPQDGLTRPAANLVAEVEQFLREQAASGCQVHSGQHRPTPLRLVVHHIQPLGMGGPNQASNWVTVCDTGHYNIHRLQGILLKQDTAGVKQPIWKQSDHGTIIERQLARAGYAAWVAAGRPGRPVYEFQHK